MKIEELNISAGAKKMLQAMNIETVNQLLEADIVSIKALFTTHPRYQAYFDEIFEAIKDLDLHFNYEYNSYYPYINSKNEDLEQNKISSLDLTPDLRKYLEKYDNLGLFFREIAYSKKKLRKFLYENIKPDKKYNWLIELLYHLGNNGTILALNIYKYQSILSKEALTFNSSLEAIIPNIKVVQALNKQDIYFIGDLVKYSKEGFSSLEGIGNKTIDEVLASLEKYNLRFEMHTTGYYEFEFSLSSFDIAVLKLDEALENKARAIGINTLDNLFFSNKVEFFTSSELAQIRKSFKDLGFDVTKSFLNSTVTGDVLEYNNLIFRKKLLEDELQKINQQLSGLFPMMYSEANSKDQIGLTKKQI